jgi:glycosyltransferase involved in cell wall biosynthesis
MPAFRPRPDWLVEAVGSLLDERGVAVEVIVVDDGSPEPVAPMLGQFEDRRLRILRIEHGGASAARNAALRAANGRYVRYFDADDVAAPKSTAHLLALADSGTVSYGATAICDSELAVQWVLTARQQGDVAVDALLARFPVRPQSVLLPTDIARAAGPWDEDLHLSHDWDYLQRVFEVAPVRGDRTIATFYRRHGDSLTANVDVGLSEAQQIVGQYFERNPELRGTPLERRARAMLDALTARVYVTHGRRRDAVGPLVRSLVRDPSAALSQALQGVPAVRGAAVRRARRA